MPVSPLVAKRQALETQATNLALLNGHDLHGFSPDKDTPTRSKAYCRTCGNAAYVAYFPDNDESAVTGAALSRRCGK